MLKSGLVSVSFRGHTPSEIIKAAKECSLSGIEWGGDIHVPVGDLETAKRVGDETRDAGLSVFAYGSYYKIGCGATDEDRVATCKTADALGAQHVRIWGGPCGSAEITPENRIALIEETRKICDVAAEYNLRLSFECHHSTLTDDPTYTLDFLQDVARNNLKTYWQPNQFKTFEENLDAANALMPLVTNVHVFHWDAEHRYPLADGSDVWHEYLEVFRDGHHKMMLEFMHDDSIASLPAAADTLNEWLEEINK